MESHDDGVLLAVLLGGEQRAPQLRVLLGVGPAPDRARDRHRPERAALRPDQPLGRGAEERTPVAAERVGGALRRARGQAAKGVGDIELHRRSQVDAAGQHHLVDPPAADGTREHPHQAAPVLGVGCVPNVASGANTGLATIPLGLGASARARAARRSHRHSSARIPAAVPGPARGRSRRPVTSPRGASARGARASWPERAPWSSGVRYAPGNPRPPPSTGPGDAAPRFPAVDAPAARSAVARRLRLGNRSGPAGSTAQAGRRRPARPSDGRSQSATSRSASIGGRDQRDRIDPRRDGRGQAWRVGRPARVSIERPASRSPARRLVLGPDRRAAAAGHGRGSGKSQPSRSAGTSRSAPPGRQPTRSRTARSVG